MIRLILKITLYSCHVMKFNLIFFPNLNCVKLAFFLGSNPAMLRLKIWERTARWIWRWSMEWLQKNISVLGDCKNVSLHLFDSLFLRELLELVTTVLLYWEHIHLTQIIVFPLIPTMNISSVREWKFFSFASIHVPYWFIYLSYRRFGLIFSPNLP